MTSAIEQNVVSEDCGGDRNFSVQCRVVVSSSTPGAAIDVVASAMTYVFTVSNDEGIFRHWEVLGAVKDPGARERATTLAVEVLAASEAEARGHLDALLGYAFEVSNDDGRMLRHHVGGATAELETPAIHDRPHG